MTDFSSDTNTNTVVDSKNNVQQEVNEFVEALVLAVTGFYVNEIPEEKRGEIISDCIELFTKFILEYTEEKYGKTHALRLKIGYETGEDMFGKFPDLKGKYEEAYQAFIKMLEETLEKEKKEIEASAQTPE